MKLQILQIADFGLAKSLSNSNQTGALTSTIFGTSAYMAPEAFRGDISPKMDIFSFGVVSTFYIFLVKYVVCHVLISFSI